MIVDEILASVSLVYRNNCQISHLYITCPGVKIKDVTWNILGAFKEIPTRYLHTNFELQVTNETEKLLSHLPASFKIKMCFSCLLRTMVV